MKVSRAGLQHLVKSEGAIPYVYDDGDGTWPKKWVSSFNTRGHPTIGVGHLITSSEREEYRPYLSGGRKMTMSQMVDLLAKDIDKRIASESWKARIQVPITQSMYDALVHQAFNTGPNAHSVRSAIAAMNRKDWAGAQSALAGGAVTSKGRRMDGLVKRRVFEAELFMQDGIPGLREAVPAWGWASGAAIMSLLIVWGAVRLRRRL